MALSKRGCLKAAWDLAWPFWMGDEKWSARLLLGAVVALNLTAVWLNVRLNSWNNDFYNALQEYDWPKFWWQFAIFGMIAAALIVVAVYQLYLRQILQIRWRRWLTERFLKDWLADQAYYRMQFDQSSTDNPDQRIADDLDRFTSISLALSIGLLNSVVTLFSFLFILWTLSGILRIPLGGDSTFDIPGYMVIAAVIYAVAGTWLTQRIGNPLVPLLFNQQRYEADFRFNLVRVRENSEQIALLQGERAERHRLLESFGRVIRNWHQIMTRTMRLTAFTSSYAQAAVVFPYLLVAPAYFFTEKIQLGGMTQTASAFSSVQEALSIFVTIYARLAEWRAVIARLDGFEQMIERASRLRMSAPSLNVVRPEDAGEIELQQLLVRLPNGTPLVAADALLIHDKDHLLLSGPSGAGKSTLLRAIAGVWPFGSGVIAIPAKSTLMMLPQRPYFPVASLHAAIVYPSEPDAFSADLVKEVLTAVGLPQLASRLQENGHWNRMFSLGEQQRLGIARALLHRPQFLFLDEATASLDEASEAALYRLLAERLAATTVVSIGHRSTLEAFHTRKVVLAREGERFKVQEAERSPGRQSQRSGWGAPSGRAEK